MRRLLLWPELRASAVRDSTPKSPGERLRRTSGYEEPALLLL